MVDLYAPDIWPKVIAQVRETNKVHRLDAAPPDPAEWIADRLIFMARHKRQQTLHRGPFEPSARAIADGLTAAVRAVDSMPPSHRLAVLGTARQIQHDEPTGTVCSTMHDNESHWDAELIDPVRKLAETFNRTAALLSAEGGRSPVEYRNEKIAELFAFFKWETNHPTKRQTSDLFLHWVNDLLTIVEYPGKITASILSRAKREVTTDPRRQPTPTVKINTD